VHTVIEKALCANFDRDKGLNHDLIALGDDKKPRVPTGVYPGTLRHMTPSLCS
jgi:hypothetical protein